MRLSRDEWALKLALLTAQRTTCCRRAVGCVLLNARGHVLSTGYNGVAAGLPHCNDEILYDVDSHDVKPVLLHVHACSGATAPSGTNLDGCQAIHAEQNALLQCRDMYAIHTAYVTASPCMTCCKLLLNTSCQRIVYVEEYPHSAAKDLWTGAGRAWEQLLVEL
jgi:dCMP deaminase